jgi:hypothetical protein
VTRRARLVSLLVALMALSGAYAAPGRTLGPTRAAASIVWSRSDRTRTPVRWRDTQQHRAPRTFVVSHPCAGNPPTPATGLPLSRFQRPPPANSIV